MNIMKYKRIVSATALSMILTLVVFGQSQTTNKKLSLDRLIERQIKGGETQTFQFDVKAGFYARAEVEQKNIDVVVSLFAPDGKLVVEMDGKDGTLWREAVSAVAEKKVQYRIEIKAYGAAYQSGSYTVKLAESRQFAPNDRNRLEAELHLSAGRKFYEQKGTANYEAAVKEYEAAIKLWRKLDNAEWEALTLTNFGWTNNLLSKNEQAIDAHTRAVKLFQKTEDRFGEGKAMNGLGNVYNDLGQYDKSLEFYEKALSIRKEIGDKLDVSETMINLGSVHESLGQQEKARDYYEQAIAIKREIKNRVGEVIALAGLSATFNDADKDERASRYLDKALILIKSFEDYQEKITSFSLVCKSYSITYQNEKRSRCYEEAITLSQKAKDRKSEMEFLDGLRISYEITNSEKAILYKEQVLSIAREIKDKSQELSTLWSLGTTYERQGKYEKALKYYEETIILSQKFKDRYYEATAFESIGQLYLKLKNYEKAQSYYEQFAAIQKELILDPSSKNDNVFDFLELANNYQRLKQYDKALEVYEKALIKFKDDASSDFIIIDLANLFKEQKEYDKAQKYLEQKLALFKEKRDGLSESWIMIQLGELFQETKQYDKAQEYYEQSLAVSLKSNDEDAGEEERFLLGKLYLELKQYKKALEYLEPTVAELQKNKFWEIRAADTLPVIVELYEGLKNPRLAIFYGKQAVNAIQKIRGEIKAFDKDTQRNFVKDKEPIYRKLADLLISEGRFSEAQTILDLLKDEEFKDVVLRRGGETVETIPYNLTEAAILARIDKLATLGREQTELRKQQKDEGDKFPADKLKRLEQIVADIKAVNVEFDNAIAALSKDDASVKDQIADIQSEKNLQSALQNLGKELNTGAVALYTVIGTEEEKDASGKPVADKTRSKFGWVILVTPKERKAYPIDVTNLEQLVFQFKTSLSSDKYDPKPLAQKIYNAIFRQTSAKQKVTLEQDLNDILGKYQDKTIMWSLDGVLRYIPMAALHDGNGYLVEKYRNVVFTKESLLWLMNQPKAKPEALGLGVSAGNKDLKMSELPGVDKELSDIIKQGDEKTGILNGSRKLNTQFKKQELLNLEDEDNKFQVVHIASHYSFNPTDQNSSYLLIGDGKYTFGEMKTENNLFGTVDLLTLSACDTGVSGNGKEAEGFAYLAQSLGAKSVIASLWEVSDTGTPELMIRFYKLRAEHPEISKGEAFRQAQLSLLGAEIKDAKITTTNRADVIDLSGEKINLPLFVKNAKHPFAHPHFWSSFVLIGNWR